MATEAIVPAKLATGVLSWSWTGLGTTDDGSPINPDLGSVTFSDKTVHITGSFGTGGTVVIEGSNDGSNWITLTDPAGNALSFTAVSLQTILQNPAYIRPRITAGDGGTNLAVTIVGRAIIQLR